MSSTSSDKLRASDGSPIGRIGLGCMGMSEFYGPTDEAASLHSLELALDLGYRHFDTADLYGRGHNETLLGRFLRRVGRQRDGLFIASKGGIRRSGNGADSSIVIDSSPGYVSHACERSLARLGVDCIDVYYLHRRSPDVPIEDTIGAMAELVKSGKIRYIGLSEVSADTLRRACSEFRVHALQSEYSLWTRDVEGPILKACADLGVTFVSYSPLGRGFLTGELKPEDVRVPGDLRGLLPRFQPGAYEHNAAILETVRSVAATTGAAMSQVALAWLLARAPSLHAIPGARSAPHLTSNKQAERVRLTEAQQDRLSAAFSRSAVRGARYSEQLLKTVGV